MDGLMFAHGDYNNWPGRQLTIGRTAHQTRLQFLQPLLSPATKLWPMTSVISRLREQSRSRRDAKRDLRGINTIMCLTAAVIESVIEALVSFIQRRCRMPEKAQNLFFHGPTYRRFSPISRRLVTTSSWSVCCARQSVSIIKQYICTFSCLVFLFFVTWKYCDLTIHY